MKSDFSRFDRQTCSIKRIYPVSEAAVQPGRWRATIVSDQPVFATGLRTQNMAEADKEALSDADIPHFH